jgi:hypothetical protein
VYGDRGGHAGASAIAHDLGDERLVDSIDIDAKKPRLELLERYCIAGRRPGRDLADDVLAPSRYDVLPKVSGVAVVARCYGLSAVRFDPCARSFSIVCS